MSSDRVSVSSGGTGGRIVRLSAHPNNYPWGKVGNESLAARLAGEAEGSTFKLDEKKPYAELWMGTHPHNPSHIFSQGQGPGKSGGGGGGQQLLSEFLEGHKEFLGDAIKFPARYPSEDGGEEDQSGGHVPFLFKILTCKEALPLQIHPDREIAERLHKEDPEKFPDSNHKPEIAVCLSDRFVGLASFRPLDQIRSLLRTIPELRRLPQKVSTAMQSFVSTSEDDEGSDSAREKLKQCWVAFLSLEGGTEEQEAVNDFTARVESEGTEAFKYTKGSISEEERRLLVEGCEVLSRSNTGDISIFASLLFLNLVELKKGQGIYVPADAPHAWLQGEIVELMAASDNVLNFGFTEDKDSLKLAAESVTGKTVPLFEMYLTSHNFDKSTNPDPSGDTITVYSTPFEEFSILSIKSKGKSGGGELKGLTGPGIAIVVGGSNVSLSDKRDGERSSRLDAPVGSVWLVGAGAELKVEGEQGVEVWMAFYDSESSKVGKS